MATKQLIRLLQVHLHN